MIKVGLIRNVTASVLRAVVLDLKDVVAVSFSNSIQFVQSERYLKYIGVYKKRYIGLLNGLLITNIITIQTLFHIVLFYKFRLDP